jgi:acyl-CoA hydrolase
MELIQQLLMATESYPIPHALLRLLLSTFIYFFRIFFFWLPVKVPTTLEINHVPPAKEATKNIITELVRGVHCDSRGIAFAGQVLSWMDICAGICAKRFTGNSTVTVAVDAVHFLYPLRENEICIIKATINRSWSSSVEVEVSVESENSFTGQVKFCCHGYFTFVTVGKKPVPKVIPQSMRDRRRYHDAQTRRQARLDKMPSIPHPCLPHNPIHIESGEEIDSRFEYGRNNSFTNSKVRENPGIIKSVPCSDSYTEVTQHVFPEHCNSLGITFGGQIMRWMEFCAAIAANRHCRTLMLVASIDSITFRQPSKQGDIITVRGMVSASYKHSVEVYVTVERETDGVVVITVSIC